jgi:hypothetical protein
MRSSSAELSSSALVFQMHWVHERSGADGEVLMQTGDGFWKLYIRQVTSLPLLRDGRFKRNRDGMGRHYTIP